MGFWKRTGSEEGEDGEIGRQGDGHGLLGCARNHLHWLPGKRTNDNWGVLCVVIAPVEPRNQEKTSSFEKDPFPSKQCTGAHLRSFDVQNYEIKIWIITMSTVFTGFGTQWLFFISKLEKMAWRTKVHVEWGHRPNSYLFWVLSKILLFGWLKKVEKTLGKVYRVKRRLCRKIKKNLNKIICFSIIFQGFIVKPCRLLLFLLMKRNFLIDFDKTKFLVIF